MEVFNNMKVKELENLIFSNIDICAVVSERPFVPETLFSGYFYEIPEKLLNKDIKFMTGSDGFYATIRIFIKE